MKDSTKDLFQATVVAQAALEQALSSLISRDEREWADDVIKEYVEAVCAYNKALADDASEQEQG
jgi:histone H3/H4